MDKQTCCSVCGYSFTPMRKHHYFVKKETVDFFSPFVKNAEQRTRKTTDILYDCFDCPQCGCQVIAKPRRGFEYIADDGLLETFVEQAVDCADKDESALYFVTEKDAEEFLEALRKTLNLKGFLSYWDYKARAGRPPRWEKEYGWTNLDAAMICESDGNRGFYIVMPSMRRLFVDA